MRRLKFQSVAYPLPRHGRRNYASDQRDADKEARDADSEKGAAIKMGNYTSALRDTFLSYRQHSSYLQYQPPGQCIAGWPRGCFEQA